MRTDDLITRLSSWGRQPSESDLAASLELAVSARRFSQVTQAVVDDKLTFSATLMRAGEVEAANRLLAEVGEEVLNEEVAMLERVNEVKVAQSMQRDERVKVTRGRLARTLAVAMLGSSLLAFSAAGSVVVGLFRDNDRAVHGAGPNALGVDGQADRVKGNLEVKVLDNVSLSMTAAQFRRYAKLTGGNIDEQELELFLLELLPTSLAEKVHFALVTGLDGLPAPVRKQIVAVANDVSDPRRGAPGSQDDTQPPAQTDEPKEPEPSPEPSEADPPSSEPSDDPSPDPEESPGEGTDLPPLLSDDDEG